MPRRTMKILTWLLCAALVCALPLSLPAYGVEITIADTEERFPEDLTPEEEAQWQEWSLEEETEGSSAGQAEELSPEEEAILQELADALEDNAPMDEVDLDNLEPNEDLPNHILNILLLGVDNRTTSLERGLSDAVVICSVDMETGSLKLSSVARDTGVIIPGFKNKNRINVAYKRGGPELSMKTVNRNFQMNIRHYVVVNIHGLADIIDALGGVELDMTSREAGRINFELRKEPMDKVKREKVKAINGLQHLDGMQAVTFARIRGIDSDLERTRRQRQLLGTLLTQVMHDMDLKKFIKLVEVALPHGDTNLTMGELFQLGTVILGGEVMQNLQSGDEVLEQFRIPIDKRFGYRNVDGNSLIYLSDRNLQFSVESLHQFIYGDTF